MLYASPEMFHVMTASHGDQTIAARSVDVRTDVFSLALVGYFLRTGRNPTSQYINLMTLLVANLECAEGLHDVLKKACEFAAKDRFADMHAFMAALRELASRPATVIVNRRPPDPPWVASPETPTPPPARPPANDADHLADADPFPLPIVRPVRPRPSHRAKVEARTLAPKHERSFSTPITAAPTTLVARTSPRVADKPTRRWIPLLAFTTIAASLALSVLHAWTPTLGPDENQPAGEKLNDSEETKRSTTIEPPEKQQPDIAPIIQPTPPVTDETGDGKDTLTGTTPPASGIDTATDSKKHPT